MSRCAGTRADGERCGGRAIEGSEWCFNHHPDYAEARKRNASKGGRRGGRGRRSPSTDELSRLQAQFEEIADRVLGGSVERGDAAVVAQLLNGARACVVGLLKAREVEEFDARLSRLEAKEGEARQAQTNGRVRP